MPTHWCCTQRATDHPGDVHKPCEEHDDGVDEPEDEEAEGPRRKVITEEQWQHRFSQRRKQIGFTPGPVPARGPAGGKSTVGYMNYLRLVDVHQRDANNTETFPVTPRADERISKRAWDASLKRWRRCLHLWDNAPLFLVEGFPSPFSQWRMYPVCIASETGRSSPGEEDKEDPTQRCSCRSLWYFPHVIHYHPLYGAIMTHNPYA